MKILFGVHQFFPESFSGTERFVLSLACQLRRMGHTVAVVTIRHEPKFLHNNEVDGIRVLALPWDGFDRSFAASTSPDTTRPGVRTLLDEGWDIVHMGHVMQVSDVMAEAVRREIPVVVTLTDFWPVCPRAQMLTIDGRLCASAEGGLRCARICYSHMAEDVVIGRLTSTLELLRRANFVAAPSEFLSTRLMKEGLAPIYVVRHGIDYANIRALRPVTAGVNLAYMSTLVPHKGIREFIRTFVRARPKNLKLRIYGGDPMESDYGRECASVACGNSGIQFCGRYAHENLSEIMNSTDVVVHPSVWWENSPLTILQAFAHRRPVLATRLGGAAEFVQNGTNGWTYELGDDEALIGILNSLDRGEIDVSAVAHGICRPRRLEEEAVEYEHVYKVLSHARGRLKAR